MKSGSYFVDVILPLPLPDLFTYSVPAAMVDRIIPGTRVVVQFGKQKVYAALVFKLHTIAPSFYEVKPVMDILDEVPVITEVQFKIWKWLSDYYLCTPGDVMAAALPSALRLQSESRIVKNEDFKGDVSSFTDREYLIYEALETQAELSLHDIEKILSLKQVMPVIRSMINKKIILVREEVDERYKPKWVEYIAVNDKLFPEDRLNDLVNTLEKKAPKQLDLLLAYFQMSRDSGEPQVNKAMALKKAGVTTTVLQALVKKEVLLLSQQREDRVGHYEGKIIAPYTLNPFQVQALHETKQAFSEGSVVLLHGVTSSGKTELYIHLITEQLNSGAQVLYLLPEIALTTQLIGRLQKHFGDRLLVYHSRFNEQERVEVWNKIIEDNSNASSTGKLVIGARSAVFLPFSRLGLIIVDEEHDHSYKQVDPAPRYNARDMAIVMGGYQDAHILLGTATPSMESYYNAVSGKYALVTLDRRHAELQMPDVFVVNMKEARKRKMVNGHFSNMLIEQITDVLALGEQAILFQNRRGFAPYLECNICSWTPLCVNCDVSLTYHKKKNELRCHYCGYMQTLPVKCAACGDQDLRMKGFGTERIEEELQLVFPEARIARLDYDTTRSKTAYHRIITSFEEGAVDILVGTQMVTKGLDFDKVQLVGILNADAILHYPEFRAHERGFQLLAQVSGRAGRRKHGRVLIQAYDVSNPVLSFVERHDYPGFYMHELNERYKFSYPPYFRLIEIRVKHRDETQLDRMSNELSLILRSLFGKRVLGPTTPSVNRIRNYFLRHLLIKLEKTLSVKEVKTKLSQALEAYRKKPENRQLIIQVDVDPL